MSMILLVCDFNSRVEIPICNAQGNPAVKSRIALSCDQTGLLTKITTIPVIMDEIELDQLRRNPKWKAILEVYHQLHATQRAQSPEFDGWTPRVHEAGEIPKEELPGIHGKLIAYGFLKFDLTGRDGGIRYQLTPLGKTGINASVTVEDDGELAESDPASTEQQLVVHS